MNKRASHLFWQEGKCLGGEGDELDLPGAENLLSNMETQTQDDLLLCINSCTQTGRYKWAATVILGSVKVSGQWVARPAGGKRGRVVRVLGLEIIPYRTEEKGGGCRVGNNWRIK